VPVNGTNDHGSLSAQRYRLRIVGKGLAVFGLMTSPQKFDACSTGRSLPSHPEQSIDEETRTTKHLVTDGPYDMSLRPTSISLMHGQHPSRSPKVASATARMEKTAARRLAPCASSPSWYGCKSLDPPNSMRSTSSPRRGAQLYRSELPGAGGPRRPPPRNAGRLPAVFQALSNEVGRPQKTPVTLPLGWRNCRSDRKPRGRGRKI
jgi:hypothetical protein